MSSQTPISAKLMNAVLSLDTYNRYNNRGLVVVGIEIGDYKLIVLPPTLYQESISFSASSYLGKNGDTIISYRGTDDAWGFSGDPFTGWSVAFDQPFKGQFNAAFRYYNDTLTALSALSNNPQTNVDMDTIRLTGHSQGGALAGLVAAFHGNNADIFAHMPFEASARTAYEWIMNPFKADDSVRAELDTYTRLIYGNTMPIAPAFGANIVGYAVDNEVLNNLRVILSSKAPTKLDPGTNNQFSLDIIERHSIAMHVLLIWELENQQAVTGWRGIAEELWGAFAADKIGLQAKFNEIDGTSTAGEKMATAVAYSVINQGVSPFGTTAVWALFGDAADIGNAKDRGGSDFLNSTAIDRLVDLDVQYAGLLARYSVTDSSEGVYAKGIARFDDDHGALMIDLTDQRWSFASDLVGPILVDPIGKAALLRNLIYQTGALSETNKAIELYGRPATSSWEDLYKPVKTVTVDLSGSISGVEGTQGTGAGSLDLFAAVAGGLNARPSGASDDLIIAGSSSDALWGGAGSDILSGGGGTDELRGDEGDDYLVGGSAPDTLFGGEGIDTAVYGGLSSSSFIRQFADSYGVFNDGDTLQGVERISFRDTTENLLRFSLDTLTERAREGDTIRLRVGVQDQVTDGGVLRDTWVYVKVSGIEVDDFIFSSASLPKITPTNSAVTALRSTGGFWAFLPTGQASIDVSVRVKVDRIPEAIEHATFYIDRYVQKVSSGGAIVLDTPVRYELTALRASAIAVEIQDRGSATSTTQASTLSQRGGYEGFNRTIDAAAGSSVNVRLDAFVVPDALKIWDPITKQVYVDTGLFANTQTASFSISSSGSGRLQVIVQTQDPETRWNLNLAISSDTLRSARGFAVSGDGTEIISKVEFATIAGSVQAEMLQSSVEESMLGDLSRSGKVYLTRSGDTSQELQVGWRIAGTEINGASDGDFAASSLSGSISFDAYEDTADLIFSALLDGDVATEGFSVTFYDPATGQAYGEIDGGASILTGEIISQALAWSGTPGADEFVGTAADEIAFGGEGNDRLIGGAGNDLLEGGASNDTLEDGAGSDLLDGGEGSDVYRVSSNQASNDSVRDLGSLADTDTLYLANVVESVLLFAAEGDDLLITNSDTLHTTRVIGQFAGYGVERLVLSNADGEADITYLRSELASLAHQVSYNLGDGAKTINGAALNYGARLALGSGLTQANVSIERSWEAEADLILRMPDGALVRLTSLFSDASYGGFAGITFADGSALNTAELIALAPWSDTEGTSSTDVMSGGAGANRLNGLAGDDVIDGGPGDDRLIGGAGNDTLIGGSGDDLLIGGGSDDTFRFGRGDGQDVIWDANNWSLYGEGGLDTIIMAPGITPSSVTVREASNGADLILGFVDAPDTLMITAALTNHFDRVEFVRFADGSVWTFAELVERAHVPTAGDDNFHGSELVDFLSGGGGNDALIGRNGNDTLVGGAGDDSLIGGGNDDIFRFEPGDGHDIIWDAKAWWLYGEGGFDTIQYGAGIMPSDVVVSHGGTNRDLRLAIAGSGDSIEILFALTNRPDRIEQVRFADGTIWNYNDIVTRAVQGTSGNDRYHGSFEGEVISGQGGNDHLIGRHGNDIMVGGIGADFMAGGGGDDIYRFAPGDGRDTIADAYEWEDNGYGGFDAIEFVGGITPMDVTVAQTPDNTGIILALAGTTDRITLKHVNTSSDDRIEEVRFSDGTVWTYQDLVARSFTVTDGDDRFFGSNITDIIAGGGGADFILARRGNDIITGGAGSDTLIGGGGDDIYRFSRGDGYDNIHDGAYWEEGGDGGNDAVEFGAGISPSDIRVTRNEYRDSLSIWINKDGDWTGDYIFLNSVSYSYHRIEVFRFADGTVLTHDDLTALADAQVSNTPTAFRDQLRGTSGADQIDGLAGSDYVNGDSGNDQLSGGEGNDQLQGGTGNDILHGGFGSDTLYGGDGNDVFLFNAGDGVDRVGQADIGFSNGNYFETLRFGVGINPSEVKIWSDDSNIYFDIIGINDRVIVSGAQGTLAENIDKVEFSNGAVWNYDYVRAHVNSSSAGNDTFYATKFAADELRGGEGDDKLNGASYDDTLRGGAGDDILVGGWGNDTIFGNGSVSHAAVGASLLVNGSFEAAGTIVGSGSWGRASANIPGWTKVNAQPFEQVYSGHLGINATEGSYWLDTDAGSGSGSNMDISQVVPGLAAGGVLSLSYDHNNRTGNASGWFDVYWNGVLVDAVNYNGSAVKTSSFTVVAVAGSNTVRFVGKGSEDSNGAMLDNVRLRHTEAVVINSDNDLLNGGLGNDALWGAAGSDTFIFDVEGGVDTIGDFSVADGDKIDLSFFSGLKFLGAGVFTRSPQVRYEAADGDTRISVDVDADGYSDLTIMLIGSVELTQQQFIL